MLENPVDIDITDCLTKIIDADGNVTNDGIMVFYDDNEYLYPYENSKLLKLILSEKIPGIVMTNKQVRKIIEIMLKSYPVLLCEDFEKSDRLKAAIEIREILEELKLL